MVMTFESDLDRVKMNQHAKYLGQRSFRLKVIVLTHIRTHTPSALLGPLKYSPCVASPVGNSPQGGPGLSGLVHEKAHPSIFLSYLT